MEGVWREMRLRADGLEGSGAGQEVVEGVEVVEGLEVVEVTKRVERRAVVWRGC